MHLALQRDACSRVNVQMLAPHEHISIHATELQIMEMILCRPHHCEDSFSMEATRDYWQS